jgi:hypothetical protein
MLLNHGDGPHCHLSHPPYVCRIVFRSVHVCAWIVRQKQGDNFSRVIGSQDCSCECVDAEAGHHITFMAFRCMYSGSGCEKTRWDVGCWLRLNIAWLHPLLSCFTLLYSCFRCVKTCMQSMKHLCMHVNSCPQL